MNIIPINGRILIKPVEVQATTPGGIYIPDTAKEKLNEAEIIAIAKNLEGQKLNLKEKNIFLLLQMICWQNMKL